MEYYCSNKHGPQATIIVESNDEDMKRLACRPLTRPCWYGHAPTVYIPDFEDEYPELRIFWVEPIEPKKGSYKRCVQIAIGERT